LRWTREPARKVSESEVGLGLLREGLPAAVARERNELAALLHLHGAILDLRDLAEGIERRVGEQVGGGLVEGERDEDRAARRAVVGARHERDLAAPRSHRHHVAGLRTHRVEFGRLQRGYRLRLERVED